MATEVRVPAAGESITEVYIGAWHKAPGERVEEGEILAELESDKATLELPAPVTGRLAQVRVGAGESVPVGAVIALIEEDGGLEAAQPAGGEERPPDAPASRQLREEDAGGPRVMPAARRLLAEHGVAAHTVEATGPGNRLLKEDVLRHLDGRRQQPPAADAAPVAKEHGAHEAGEAPQAPRRVSERVPLSPIRRRIAERLVAAQHNAALLTTFNEIDMTAVIALRREHQEAFKERHGVKLGFMSFFVKAAVRALCEFPQLNAEIVETERGLEAIYHHYCDIGIAIGAGKGLVVPVLRNAEAMSFAQIERAIADLAARARENKITLAELEGGTFTISNGGVYGSLFSTPIVNPPQSAILGLHAIQERPVARGGQVEVRPMMYAALTYDHRIVDGREAVTFLRRIKELIEEPIRLLLDL